MLQHLRLQINGRVHFVVHVGRLGTSFLVRSPFIFTSHRHCQFWLWIWPGTALVFEVTFEQQIWIKSAILTAIICLSNWLMITRGIFWKLRYICNICSFSVFRLITLLCNWLSSGSLSVVSAICFLRIWYRIIETKLIFLYAWIRIVVKEVRLSSFLEALDEFLVLNSRLIGWLQVWDRGQYLLVHTFTVLFNCLNCRLKFASIFLFVLRLWLTHWCLLAISCLSEIYRLSQLIEYLQVLRQKLRLQSSVSQNVRGVITSPWDNCFSFNLFRFAFLMINHPHTTVFFGIRDAALCLHGQ